MLFDKFNVPLSDNEQPPACKTVTQAFTQETGLTLVLFKDEYRRSMLVINDAVAKAMTQLNDPNRPRRVKQFHTAAPEQWIADREQLLCLAQRMLSNKTDAQASRLANLPKTQDRHLHKTRPIVLARTRSILRNDIKRPIQMRLELLPCYDSLEHYHNNVPVRDVRSIRVTLGPVAYGPTQYCQVYRGPYVSISNVKPGDVYCDNIDEEYLFLGRINVAFQTAFEPENQRVYLEPETSKSKPKYVYIRLTPELKQNLHDCRNLEDITGVIQNSIGPGEHILGTVLLQDGPKRFRTFGGTLLRPECVTPDRTAVHPPALQYSYDHPTPCVAKRTHKILLRSPA